MFMDFVGMEVKIIMTRSFLEFFQERLIFLHELLFEFSDLFVLRSESWSCFTSYEYKTFFHFKSAHSVALFYPLVISDINLNTTKLKSKIIKKKKTISLFTIHESQLNKII